MNRSEEKRNRRKTNPGITRGSIHGITRFLYPGLTAIACALLIISPVLAAPKYMSGSPELSASLSGSNEVRPGDTVPLKVVIENRGFNEFAFSRPALTDPGDLPEIAKFLTVSLDAGNAPVSVTTGPQKLGDLAGSSTTTCIISMEVDPDAAAGSYNLSLAMQYSYLYEADQYGNDTIQYFYKEKNETISLPFNIKRELHISVLSVEGEHLNAGTEGFINLTVENVGYDNGRNAVITILRNEQSPLLPTLDSMYIGDFSVGQIISSRFKVSVSGDAGNKTYPVDVLVTYENSDGDQATSDRETIGVPVGNKFDFDIISAPAELSPGQKKTITVLYTNTGGATAYNAQAVISPGDLFTGSDTTAFLGTLAPGEVREAAFTLSLDSAATMKEYGIDSRIQYRDALDNDVISDPIKLRIQVQKDTGLTALLANPLILGIIAIVITGAGLYVFRKRTRSPG
jgi:hypothetical protein